MNQLKGGFLVATTIPPEPTCANLHIDKRKLWSTSEVTVMRESDYVIQDAAPELIAAHEPKFLELQTPHSSKKAQRFLSVVVPIYNDGCLAEQFCTEMQRVMSAYLGSEELEGLIEVLFIDDGSTNDSLAQLCALSETFRFVSVFELSKNFGQHIAQSCGYAHSSGMYVATANVDLQDPLYELPRLLDCIRNGQFDYVRGLRRKRQDPFLTKVSSSIFLCIFERLAGIKISGAPSTLRVMNRLYVDSFNRYSEKLRFALGLEYWLGFKSAFLEIDHHERKHGKSSYDFSKRLSMARDAIVAFSDLPLKIGIYIGLLLIISAILLGIWQAFTRALPPGFTAIVLILLFSQGTVLTVLGIIGLYIGSIFKEVQNRPLYVVRKTYNYDELDPFPTNR